MERVFSLIKQKKISIVFMLSIMAIGLFNIKQLYGPIVMPDEMGYWSAGAYFIGKDWSGVMCSAPYYAYGYGILLASLLKLNNPVLAFRIAILINVLLLMGVYLLLIQISKELFDNKKMESIYPIISFVLCIYPFNFFQSQSTSGEIPMVFIYILLLWLFIKFLKSKDILLGITIDFLIAFLFAFHLRNIGILIAFFLILLFMTILKQMEPYKFIIMMFVMAILVILVMILKEQVISNVYLNSVTVEKNDFSGQTDNIVSMFSIAGMKNLIINCLGRFFYLGCTSFLIIYFGIYDIVLKFIAQIKNRKTNFSFWVYLFIILVLFGEIGISAISMIFPYRIDNVIYGRYSEHVILPVMLIGIVCLINGCQKKTKRIMFILFSIFQIGSSLVLYVFFIRRKLVLPSDYSIVGIPKTLVASNFSPAFSYSVLIAIVSVAIASIFFAALNHYKTFSLCVISVLWLYTGYLAANDLLYSEKYLRYEFFELIPEMQKIPNSDKIYYIVDDEDSGTSVYWHIYKFKFFIPDANLQILDIDNIETMDEDAIILSHHSSKTRELMDQEYTGVFEKGVFKVYVQ